MDNILLSEEIMLYESMHSVRTDLWKIEKKRGRFEVFL
jgi:hypothetical protein